MIKWMIPILIAGCIWQWANFLGFLPASGAEIAKQETARLQIETIDRQHAREVRASNMMMFIQAGKEMFWAGFFFVGMIGFIFALIAWKSANDKHIEKMIRLHIEAMRYRNIDTIDHKPSDNRWMLEG